MTRDSNTLRLYDVYICYTRARTSYRALPHPSEWPACAEAHLGTVTAAGKRDATRQIMHEREIERAFRNIEKKMDRNAH